MVGLEEDWVNDNPYCPICDGCGEDGCCSATHCRQHPDGHYCKTYLAELKFGYRMYHQIMELIDDDPKYKEQIDKIRSDVWDFTFRKEEN
jgi:hypothetical protein